MAAEVTIGTVTYDLVLRAQEAGFAPSVEEEVIEPPLVDAATLDAARDVVDNDLLLQDTDGDTIRFADGYVGDVAAEVTVDQRGNSATAYIHAEDLDKVVRYLQALQTIRDAS